MLDSTDQRFIHNGAASLKLQTHLSRDGKYSAAQGEFTNEIKSNTGLNAHMVSLWQSLVPRRKIANITTQMNCPSRPDQSG